MHWKNSYAIKAPYFNWHNKWQQVQSILLFNHSSVFADDLFAVQNQPQ